MSIYSGIYHAIIICSNFIRHKISVQFSLFSIKENQSYFLTLFLQLKQAIVQIIYALKNHKLMSNLQSNIKRLKKNKYIAS
ncbi:hypothetical protein B0A62_14520 [Flavobacterium hydatis]|uniref:Uncharacterized protein n=1 Tax=Flavobacterium hydatis TaxID=991 RepID=A0A086AF13_FLAHY|nr:hypothetical protein IW20_15085 [Flavobacterium hydatis]OXA93045.1 hypothetical protein B0A62_14520 [Flavobacterium hydatis]